MENNFKTSKISYFVFGILGISVIAQLGKFIFLQQTFEKIKHGMPSAFYITGFLELLVVVLIVLMAYKLFELMKVYLIIKNGLRNFIVR